MDNNTDLIRLFVAVDFQQVVIEEVQRIQTKLHRQRLFEGRFIKPDHVHLTLKFVGAVLEKELLPIASVLKIISHPIMKAQLSNVDVFFVDNLIKIIYLGVICPELESLAKKVEEKLTPWVEPEQRNFVSHATIARVKRVEDKQRLLGVVRQLEIQSLKFTFKAFVLKQSVLSVEGPQYTNLETYMLGE